MLAGSRWLYDAISEQHSRRCGVTTARRPPPRWAAVLQGEVTLRIHISIVFIVRLAHNTSICSLARDGRTMPSTSSTVAVVESQPRGDRGHGGPRSLRGSHPSYAYQRAEPPSRPVWRTDNSRTVSSLLYAWPITRPYARWLATAVPGRQRVAQSPLRSHNGGATAAMLDRGRVWFGA